MVIKIFEMSDVSSALEKIEHKNGEQVIYITYNMPEHSGFSKYSTQAKPLLDAIASAFPEMNEQAKKLYEKQNEIADHYQQEVERLEDKASEAAARFQNEIENQKALIDEITAKYEKTLSEKFEELKALRNELKLTQQKLIAREQDKVHLEKITNDSLTSLENANQVISNLKKDIEKAKEDCVIVEDNVVDKLKKRYELATYSNKTTRFEKEASACEEELSSGLKIKMNTTLPTFNGRPESNVNEWLYAAKRMLEFGKYAEQTKVGIASNYLRELASQDYLLYEQTNGKHNSWEQFETYMRKKYTAPNHNQIIRNRMQNLKQITSVKDFYIDFRKLAIQASNMNDDEKLDIFLKGLKKDIAKHVNMKQVITLDKAYEEADLYETYNYERVDSTFVSMNSNKPTNQQHSNNSNRYNNNNSNSNNTNINYGNNLNSYDKHNLNSNVSNYNSSNNTSNNFNTNSSKSNSNNSSLSEVTRNGNSYKNLYRNEVCCKCNQRGHIGEYCRSSDLCSKCNIKGHLAEECRQHLLCTFCNRRGHLEVRCFLKQ